MQSKLEFRSSAWSAVTPLHNEKLVGEVQQDDELVFIFAGKHKDLSVDTRIVRLARDESGRWAVKLEQFTKAPRQREKPARRPAGEPTLQYAPWNSGRTFVARPEQFGTGLG